MNVDVLRTICSTYGPTGRETAVAGFLKESLAACGFNVSIDVLGNVIARRGEGPCDVFLTHLDQRSWVVEHRDKDGFLQIKSIPADSMPGSGWGFDDKENVYLISLHEESNTFKAESLADGVGNIGDFLVPGPEFRFTGEKIFASALSDRVCPALLLEAARGLENPKKPVAFVFYVGRYLGFMGLTSSLVSLQAERLFVLETFENETSTSGGKVLLPVRTQKSIPSSNISGVASKIAVQEGIEVVKIIVSQHQCAADVLARTGIESLVLGIPLRNHGAAIESLKTADYDALLKLVWRLEK